MRIVFVNIYPPDTAARYLLSSYVLKAYLAAHGSDLPIESMAVLNFSDRTETDTVVARVSEHLPDIIASSCYSWNVEKNRALVGAFRQSLPKAIQVWGGPELAEDPILRYPAADRADYYVIGEGERKLLKLLRYLTAGADDREEVLPSGIYQWKDGAVVGKADDDHIADLDEIPSIYLTGAIEDRLYVRQQVFVETQRGCRFRCKYCVYPKFMPNLAYHSLERIFGELTFLVEKKHVQAIRFCDAGFTSDLARAKRIVQRLIALKASDQWTCKWIYWEFNFETADEEFLRLAARLKMRDTIKNCSTLAPLDRAQHYSEQVEGYTAINCIGVQSLNQEALKAVGRPPVSIDRLSAFLSQVREKNLVVKLDLILGLPFETTKSYYAGLEALLPLFRDTDHVLNIHRLEVLPGSLLEKLCITHNIAFSKSAPHLAYSTDWISERDFRSCCRITALLFRIVNSPLRPAFFDLVGERGKNHIAVVEKLLTLIDRDPALSATRLATGQNVDDRYWNDEIFADIPSALLKDMMNCLAKQEWKGNPAFRTGSVKQHPEKGQQGEPEL